MDDDGFITVIDRIKELIITGGFNVYPSEVEEALRKVTEQGRRLLGQGVWVIMFPEGTRIPRGEKGSYQSSGARLAIDCGVPVIPIAVTSARCWPPPNQQ